LLNSLAEGLDAWTTQGIEPAWKVSREKTPQERSAGAISRWFSWTRWQKIWMPGPWELVHSSEVT